MLGHRQLGFDDYLEILRRRWWIILIPAIVGCVGTYLYSRTLANEYTSRTLVLVEQQKVPDTYVKSVVTGDITQMLGTMQEQILSRTRLQPIIEKFGLFKDQKGHAPMEDLVDRLRKSISVIPVKSLVSTSEGALPGFTITFTANDPRLAQQVCSEITSMFIEESLRLREQSAVGTTDFLKDQLDDAKRNLDAQDAKLADFKRKYMGSLPGNTQTDMNMLAGFTSQLDAVTSQLSRAQQDKTYQESLLAQQVAAWQASQKPGEVHEDMLQLQLTALQAQLTAMQGHYTPDHPDVVKLKEDIAALKKRIADNTSTASTKDKPAQPAQPAQAASRLEPSAIQQLRFQLHQTEILIKEKTAEQVRLKQQLSTYQARLSMTPGVEQQYSELTRGYQTALQFYNDLLAKKNQSEMAMNLERRQQGQQFTIMDPADLPGKPSYPDRQEFAGAGLGVGLALGVGITLLLELRDKALRTEADVEHFLGLPTLATVPLINGWKEKGKRKARPGKNAEATLGLGTSA
ncbi:MAG: lipopolysaccharide biosynthesis protein [Acidobacteriia bacterium]|nr:lipopolysaccharide biosynthesis protein [Terriglobia bacterium]